MLLSVGGGGCVVGVVLVIDNGIVVVVVGDISVDDDGVDVISNSVCVTVLLIVDVCIC